MPLLSPFFDMIIFSLGPRAMFMAIDCSMLARMTVLHHGDMIFRVLSRFVVSWHDNKYLLFSSILADPFCHLRWKSPGSVCQCATMNYSGGREIGGGRQDDALNVLK